MHSRKGGNPFILDNDSTWISACARTGKVGFTLIELLISLLLLSCILIGFDAFSIRSLQGVRDSYYHTQAINQIASMEERLRALQNHEGIEEQIALWNSENVHALPQGVGTVDGFYPEYTIQVCWRTHKECIKEDFEV